jgi:leader peptidase (prepilin peptidase)/N-methyltransferase
MGVLINFLSPLFSYHIEHPENKKFFRLSSRKDPIEIQKWIHYINWRGTVSWLTLLLAITISLTFPLYFGWHLRTLIMMLFAFALLILALIDYESQYLPDAITIPFLWLGLLVQLIPNLSIVPINQAVMGSVIGYMLLRTISFFYLLVRKQDGVGYGDMKLMAMIGAWMGFFVLPFILMLSSISFLIWSLASFAANKKSGSSLFSFGPWIVFATFISMLVFVKV